MLLRRRDLIPCRPHSNHNQNQEIAAIPVESPGVGGQSKPKGLSCTMIECLMTAVIAMDVYTENTPGAPKPRFDLPDVYYCCDGPDLIYTDKRPGVTVALFTRWKKAPYTGSYEIIDAATAPYVLPATTIAELPLGRTVIDVRAYSADGEWIGWLADETFITCHGDVNLDLTVDVSDLLLLLETWGSPGGGMDDDGATSISIMLQILGGWGDCDQQ